MPLKKVEPWNLWRRKQLIYHKEGYSSSEKLLSNSERRKQVIVWCKEFMLYICVNLRERVNEVIMNYEYFGLKNDIFLRDLLFVLY